MNLISVSGGKDSTAMLLRMIEKKIRIDRIFFVDTGLELPETYDFIIKLNNYCIEKINKKITILKDYKDWDYYFYKIHLKGNNKGKIRGFPYIINPCWYQRDCKNRLLSKHTGKHDISFIGFAKGEEKRISKVNKNMNYPLIEWGMTESDCMNYCRERNMLNPLYNKYGFKRIGCWLCPYQPKRDLLVIKEHYPKLWSKLLKYESDSPHGFKPNFKLEELK